MPASLGDVFIDIPDEHKQALFRGLYHKTERVANSCPVWESVGWTTKYLSRGDDDHWYFTQNECNIGNWGRISGWTDSSELNSVKVWKVLDGDGEWVDDDDIHVWLVDSVDIFYIHRQLVQSKEEKAKLEEENGNLEKLNSQLEKEKSDLVVQQLDQERSLQTLNEEKSKLEKEKSVLELEIDMLQSLTKRFVKVVEVYPDVVAGVDEILVRLSNMEAMLAESGVQKLVEEALKVNTQNWLPTQKLQSCEADDLRHSDLQSLQALLGTMSNLMEAQPGILGKELGDHLCSQLESLLRQRDGPFAQEEESFREVIQRYVVDFKVQVEQRGQELSLVLTDQTSRENELLEKVREASYRLSEDEFLDSGTVVEQERMHAVIELLQVLRDKYVAVSKGEALTNILSEKRASFEKEQAVKALVYESRMSAYRQHAEDTKQKLQQWDQHVETSQAESKSAQAAFEARETHFAQLKQTGSLCTIVESMTELEEARSHWKEKEDYAGRITELSALNCEKLRAEQLLAEKLAERSEQGWKLQQEFGKWILSLYDGIDVRAENNIAVFRRELPSDHEKFKQLHTVARADVERRRNQTWQAVPGTQKELSDCRERLSRLQRCRCQGDRLSSAKAEYTALLTDAQSLEGELHKLKDEEQALRDLTPLILSELEDGLTCLSLSGASLPQNWVQDVFFTKVAFDVPFVQFLPVSAAQQIGTPQPLSIGSSASSHLISASVEFSEDGDFTVVDHQSAAQSTLSAPSPIILSRCFLPDCELLTLDGPVPVSNLTLGSELLAIGGQMAIIKALRSIQPQDQDVVTISCGNAFVTVTASHEIAEGESGQALQAGDLRSSSHVHILDTKDLKDDVSKFEVNCVAAATNRELKFTSVVEVELSDPDQVIFLKCEIARPSFQLDHADLFMLVFGASPQKTLFAVAGKPGTCLTVTEDDPREIASSVHSDPTHLAIPKKRIVRTIRPPHDDKCKAICRYHFKGQCRSGALCPRCHHPSHYKGQHAPTHRSSRGNKRRQDGRSQSAGPV